MPLVTAERKMLRFSFLAVFLGTFCLAPKANAFEGEPVAVVRQADGSILIETMWNLYAEVASEVADDDLFARTSDTQSAGVRLIRVAQIPDPPGVHQPGHFVAYVSRDGLIDRTLDRLANRSTATWKAGSTKPIVDSSPNAMHVRSIDNVIVVNVDGVKIAHMKIQNCSTQPPPPSKAVTCWSMMVLQQQTPRYLQLPKKPKLGS